MKKVDSAEAVSPAVEDDNSHTLDTPIHRGETSITKVTLRKPAAGELRGLSLSDVLQLDVGSLQKLLPRISNPTLTEQEVAKMDPADLLQLGGIVVGFLLTRQHKEQNSPGA